MNVLAAEFLRSGTDRDAGAGWPAEGPPEVAFAGRSNVGKSALLQALLQRHGMVRISATPGRTRLINFFRVVVAPPGGGPVELRLVDLPGFGYAKVAKRERQQWLPFVAQYLGGRAALRVCVVLVDARRAGTLFDETEIIKYLTVRGVVVLPVITKVDKLAKHERKPARERLHRLLDAGSLITAGNPLGSPIATGNPLGSPIAVSAIDGSGVDELWRRIVVALAPPRT
jgi:GTP-binding protein